MEPSSPTLRVLLVDDDDLILRAASRALRAQLHCEVLTAASGYEAIALVKFGERFDVAAIDLEMPGLDGEDLLKLLGELAPELPVGVWTGKIDISRGLERADFVIRKSQPIRDLGYAILGAARERSSMVRELRQERAGGGRGDKAVNDR